MKLESIDLRNCTASGCSGEIRARGLCAKHYERDRRGRPLGLRTGRPPVPFWDRVDRSGGFFACWPWTGPLYRDGRGHVWYGGRLRRAHQVAWIEANGPIPEGQGVLHTCDNPPCCNPLHLFAGTQLDNIADMVAKGRHRNGAMARQEAAL